MINVFCNYIFQMPAITSFRCLSALITTGLHRQMHRIFRNAGAKVIRILEIKIMRKWEKATFMDF